MQRRLARLLLAAWTACLACAGSSDAPPDVVLVTLDTTRADHLGVYGYGRDTSPQLDRFAADAVTFDRAWAAGAWTLPTHASLVTGRFASAHGARFEHREPEVALSEVLEGEFFEKHEANRLPEDEVTLAELLAERGYATAVFAAGPWLAPPFGLLQGYEHRDASEVRVGGRSAAEITDRFAAWLDGVPADRPVHVLVNYFDPHSPYEPPAGFDTFPAAKRELDPNQDEIFINGGGHLSASQREAIIDRYDGEIRYMDHHFGRLLQLLRDAGRYENAWIVAVADHGELFGEYGVLGHGRWLYEPVVRVPLLVHFPGGRDAGTREDATVSQVDLLPWIAADLGLTLPRPVDGVAIGARRGALAEVFRDPFSVKTYGARYDRDLVAWMRWPWKLIASDRAAPRAFALGPRGAERPTDEAPLEALAAELSAAAASIERRTERVPAAGVDEALRGQLRDLGYVE